MRSEARTGVDRTEADTTAVEPRPERTLSRRRFLASVGGAGGAVAAGVGGAGRARAQQGSTRTVEMTDGLVFDPEEITVAPGTTVVWENVGSVGHSVTAYEADIPADTAYWASGGFETEDAARSAYSAGDPDSGDVAGGETYEHTFEVEGEHPYFCIPHESVGMIGTVVVSADATPPPAETAAAVPDVGDAARTIGIAVTVVLVATVSFAYFLLKYGGDYDVVPGDE